MLGELSSILNIVQCTAYIITLLKVHSVFLKLKIADEVRKEKGIYAHIDPNQSVQ